MSVDEVESHMVVRARADARWARVVAVLDEMARSPRRDYELEVAGNPARRTAPLHFPTSDATPRAIIAVELGENGHRTVDGDAVTDVPVALRAHMARAAGDEPWVVIRADAAVAFGAVVDATRAAQDGGGFVFYSVVPLRAATVAKLIAREWKECPFPPPADVAKIDQAVVVVRASVDGRGKATSVTILQDPGAGFGEAARDCAMHAVYEPARDASGQAVAGDTAPFRVRFER